MAVQLLILTGVYGSYGFEWCRSRPDYALIKLIFWVKYKLSSTDTICGIMLEKNKNKGYDVTRTVQYNGSTMEGVNIKAEI